MVLGHWPMLQTHFFFEIYLRLLAKTSIYLKIKYSWEVEESKPYSHLFVSMSYCIALIAHFSKYSLLRTSEEEGSMN